MNIPPYLLAVIGVVWFYSLIEVYNGWTQRYVDSNLHASGNIISGYNLS